MEETVVVTLQCASYREDYELPTNVPLGELYPRLLAVLKKRSDVFSSYLAIILEYNHAGMLDRTATLADYGILRGHYLDVVQEELYHGIG